jgi:hypothetical protein
MSFSPKKPLFVRPSSGGQSPTGKPVDGTARNDAFVVPAAYLSDGYGEDFVINGGKGKSDYLAIPLDSYYLRGFATPSMRLEAGSNMGPYTQFFVRGEPRFAGLDHHFSIQDVEYLVMNDGVFKVSDGLRLSDWRPAGFNPVRVPLGAAVTSGIGTWDAVSGQLIFRDSSGKSFYSHASDISVWPGSQVADLYSEPSSTELIGHVVVLNQAYNVRKPLSGSWIVGDSSNAGIGLFPDGTIAGWTVFDGLGLNGFYA